MRPRCYKFVPQHDTLMISRHRRPMRFPSAWIVRTRVWSTEALRVAHRGPGVRLNVGQHLAQMVGVVVNPLVQEVVDGQKSDFGVVSSAVEIIGCQRLHECDAGGAPPDELYQEFGRVALLVLALAGDSGRIPGRES